MKQLTLTVLIAATLLFSSTAFASKARAPKHAIPPKAIELKQKGNLLFGQSDTMAAVEAYTEALTLAPRYFEAYYNRGVAWQHLALYHKAIVDFDRALELKPSDPDTLYLRGVAHEATKQLQRALDDLKKASKKGNHQAEKFLDESNLKARITAFSKRKPNPLTHVDTPPTRSVRIVDHRNEYGGKTITTLFSKGDPLYEGDEGMFKQLNYYDGLGTLIKSETLHNALFNAKNSRNKTVTYVNELGATTLIENHLTGHDLGKIELLHYGSGGVLSKKETVTLSQYQLIVDERQKG